jgi:hypothetical protein
VLKINMKITSVGKYWIEGLNSFFKEALQVSRGHREIIQIL